MDTEIKSHIILSCRSTRLRRRALTDSSLTLQQIVDVARSMEMSERQTKVIEGGNNNSYATADKTVAQVDAARKPPKVPSRTNRTCRNCGKDYPHFGGRMNCPAFGTTCRSCGKANHWSNCCRSSTVSSGRPTSSRPFHGRQQQDRQ